MPLDDLRPSKREPVAAPPEADEETEFVHPADRGPPRTPEEKAAHLERWMVVARQELADVRAGRIEALPWDDAADRWMFEEDA